MSKKKSKDELTEHKEKALKKLDAFIDGFIQSDNESDNGRADKLSYWIEDYAKFLKKEQTFDSRKSIKYKKGDIVDIHLGYRLGSEEGGRHFAVVLDVSNKKSSDTMTVIPLTSFKPHKKLHDNSVFLGNELFKAIIGKHDRLNDQFEEAMEAAKKDLADAKSLSILQYKERRSKVEKLRHQIKDLSTKQERLEELRDRIIRMKTGSVALVDQITTVSKLRIFDPAYSKDVLYGIRLSSATMNLIDDKVAELFLSNYKPQKPEEEK